MKSSNLMKMILPLAFIAGAVVVTVVLVMNRPVLETRPAEILPTLVRVLTVESEDLQLTVYSQGSVMPRTQSTLGSEVSGRVEYVSQAFAAGGFFEKGDLLVRLDARDAELSVTRAESEVARAQMSLTIEEEEARVAEEEWAQLGRGTPSALVTRKPQLAEARATLASAEASLHQAQLNLSRTEIRAPFAGRVRVKNVDMGQFVNTGSTLATIYSVDYAEVRLPIPDDQLAYVDAPLHFRGEHTTNRGPEVVLATKFAGKQFKWTGKVVRLEGEIDPQSRMVHAVAQVKNPYGRGEDPDRPPLSVGLYVNAAVTGHLLENVIVVPRSVMRNANELMVVDSDDRLRFRTVDILRLEPNRAIIQGGLEPGERVCLSAIDAPVNGMQVEVLKESTPEPSLTNQSGEVAQ